MVHPLVAANGVVFSFLFFSVSAKLTISSPELSEYKMNSDDRKEGEEFELNKKAEGKGGTFIHFFRSFLVKPKLPISSGKLKYILKTDSFEDNNFI